MPVSSIAMAIPTYMALSKNEAGSVGKFEKSDAQTKADIAQFQKLAPSLTTPDALLKNYKALSFVLEAYGMSSSINQTALLKKLMTENPASKTSFALRSGNLAFMRFAKAMAQFNPPPFSTSAGVTATVTAAATARFESQQDSRISGLADALYFTRQAHGITNLNQILADPRLLNVVSAAANLPDQFSSMDYKPQIALLKKQVDVKKFQDAGFVAKYVQKYLAISAANTAGVQDPNGAIATLNGTSSASDILSALPQSSSSGSGNPILSLFV